MPTARLTELWQLPSSIQPYFLNYNMLYILYDKIPKLEFFPEMAHSHLAISDSPCRSTSQAPLTVGEHAYRKIRADIVFARLTPGQKLGLKRLKEEYDVSVSTLREILSRLGSEDLVIAEGQRGFQVAPVSLADLRESPSSGCCWNHTRSSCRSGTAIWNGKVPWSRRITSWHCSKSQMLAGDKTQAATWKRYDLEFHRALISACASRALLDMYRGNLRQVFALLDGGTCVSRRGGSERARDPVGLRAQARRQTRDGHACAAYQRMRRVCGKDRTARLADKVADSLSRCDRAKR